MSASATLLHLHFFPYLLTHPGKPIAFVLPLKTCREQQGDRTPNPKADFIGKEERENGVLLAHSGFSLRIAKKRRF